ncbi:HlyD family efflux transporter periplasmic adaptor subunit [Desulfosporosinus sp. BG]|uniref:HlyD family efflux transporter periplasmic adaptor subunit n=1 Tax=Desulfosporosinus sp. BG TaxID=1633135 RepID=UPI00083B536E|nr:HlyD family efflux transporter periplasmic adaptor subunit [Desulfosporosinus sp. BG]ODA39581.1 Membrane-fusion protein [Desulfosporosinus sp. BG]
MEGKRRKPAYWFWGILFIVLTGGILWSYRSSLTAGDIKFAVAQTGTITHERKVMATFANEEIPISAPSTGKIQFLGENGQRFRRGEAVAILQTAGAAPGMTQDGMKQTILAAKGGLFFHQSDGLESILTSQNLNSMDLNKLLAQTANVKTAGATVQAGEIVGKIVNNLIPTQAFIELPSIDGLTIGKTLRLTAGNQTVSAKILRKSDTPKGVIVQFPHYVDGSAAQRRQDITWSYLPSTSGVLVPKSALWTQGEELGIFLWDGGVVHFKKVTVLDQDDSQACIENLPSGIPVVITPREGLEGLVADVKNI